MRGGGRSPSEQQGWPAVFPNPADYLHASVLHGLEKIARQRVHLPGVIAPEARPIQLFSPTPVQTTERRSGLRELIEEVVRTAQAIQREEESVHEMIHDHTVDLVRAIRANAKLKEMKAYLSGLKFQLLRQSQ